MFQLASPRPYRGRQPNGVVWLNKRNPLSRGMVAGWLFGSNYGADLSGNGNWGALNVAPTVIALPTGNALKFNGTNNYVLVAESAPLRFTNSFTILFGFQTASTTQTNAYVMARNNATSGGAHQTAVIYGFVANTIEVFALGFTGTDPRTGSGISVNDNLSHQIAYCYDGTTWAGYKDGQSVFSTSRTFSLDTFALDGWYFGQSGEGNFINAALSNVYFFNRALSPSEIIALYWDPYQFLISPEDVVAAQLGLSTLLTSVFSDSSGACDLSLAARSANERQRTVWWS